MLVGQVCQSKQSPKLSKTGDVNAADIWNEGKRSYQGRSHGREKMNFESRLKQDLS
jgi:hypothetical protein